MKPYDSLTYLGRVRRMRRLASVALAEYGLADAHFKLRRAAGNFLFRVYEKNPTRTGNEIFAEGQYLLRVHQPGYQAREGIELELAWLSAMRRDANLPVPEPVPTLDGKLLTQVSIPGIPEERDCSLLRWMKGRCIPNSVRPMHYQAQGRLMARMHHFAAHWQPPPGLTKRHYDWNGLFRNVEGTDLPWEKVWSRLPDAYGEPFQLVAQRVLEVMKAWGQDLNVYGLIHADLGTDANMLFWKGEARPIDFDDSGYGYWVYDLAISLEHVWDDLSFSQTRDALLEGYASFRSLPREQLAQLELFMAAVQVYLGLWAAGMTFFHPRHLDELNERMDRAYRLVRNYLAQS